MRIRNTVIAVATAATLLTGCSGGGSSSEEPGTKSPGSEQADPKAAAGAALSETELRKALSTANEATGYQAKDNDAAAVRPKADKTECQALADMTATGTARAPEANAWANRSFSSTTEAGLSVTASLLSYEGEGAQETVAGIREALKACPDGFETTGNNGGATVAYTSVTTEQSLKGGEETVSWVMTGEAQGQQIPMHLTVVREGNTLALFFTLHLMSPEKAELPKSLFDDQVTKLADAVKSA